MFSSWCNISGDLKRLVGIILIPWDHYVVKTQTKQYSIMGSPVQVVRLLNVLGNYLGKLKKQRNLEGQ